MKFSVLLPTRNGGAEIRNTIKSVLDQSYRDMELVVVDNASTDDTEGVVRSFEADDRLRYLRQERLVAVTENWKRALDASSGDFFVMLGDDDCLLPNYFTRLASALHEYQNPDCISYDGYLYLFPAALEGVSDSYFADSHYNLFKSARNHTLSREARLTIVRHTFQHRSAYLLNVQTNLIARQLAERLPGGIFHAPFPDFYAMSAVLLEARKFVCLNEKLVVVGVSPKSFGHFYYGQQQSEGMRYLGSTTSFHGLLPGDELLNAKQATLIEVRAAYAGQLGGIKPDRRGYVLRQVLAWYREFTLKLISGRTLVHRLALLTPQDWSRLGISIFDPTIWKFLRRRLAARKTNPKDEIVLGGVRLRRFANVRNILEFARVVSVNGGTSAEPR